MPSKAIAFTLAIGLSRKERKVILMYLGINSFPTT
jgi:hypothetical protein